MRRGRRRGRRVTYWLKRSLVSGHSLDSPRRLGVSEEVNLAALSAGCRLDRRSGGYLSGACVCCVLICVLTSTEGTFPLGEQRIVQDAPTM